MGQLMGDNEAFSDWMEQGEKDQTVKSAIYEIMDQNKELAEALKQCLMPAEMYRAYGWPDRDGIINKCKRLLKKHGQLDE
jgi:hypothetical protein